MEHRIDIVIQQCYGIPSRKSVVMNNMNALSLLHGKCIAKQMRQPMFSGSEHCVRLKVNINAATFHYPIDTQ